MAFNVGSSSKQVFQQLKQLSPRRRVEAVSSSEGATWLSMLTPVQFAELFPKYYQRGLPDVGGFRDAISKMSRQKQEDINFGLSQGANSLESAEQIGSKRRASSPSGDTETVTSTGGYSSGGSLKAMIDRAAAKYGIDPRMMYGIVKGESGHGNTYDKNENLKTQDLSYGPFQMNILRAGMEGDKFQKATGLSVKDPSSLEAQADWVARKIKNLGSDPAKVHAIWHGYKGNVDWSPKWGTMGAAAPTPGQPGTGSGPDFSQHAMFKGVNNYHGKCGIGSRTFAGHMFGNNYFFNKTIGSGGSELAGSLSTGNNYFQNSGMFRGGKPVAKEALTQEYLNSLPIGTVVSSQGGSRGGHVQIKIGPNQWASDTVQSGFFHGNSYSNFVVHQPNEAGLAALAKNGVIQPGEMGAAGQIKTAVTIGDPQTVQVAAQKTAAAAAPAPPAPPTQPNIPPEVPDTQARPAPGQTAAVNKPEKAAAPEVKDRTFNVNRGQLISAIKQTDEFKNTFGSSLATDDMIYNGFFDDARTKQLMAKTGSSFDPNTGQVKIGNYEKFQKSVGMDTSKILTEVPSSVPSHAGGGREKVKGHVDVTPLRHKRRGDTAMVTDASGKQFTVNPQKETMTVNPSTGIMEVKPNKGTDQMDMEKLMAIVRRQESGSFEGNYNADLAAKSHKKGQRHDTASGAYQYNNRTWKGVLRDELNMPHILKQYPRAVNAPKEIQDMVTQKRFEKWRSQGKSDQEIILHHFTGNFAGKLDPKAAKGNPTPAQYARDIANHSSEYDKMRATPTAVAQQATPAPKAPVQVAPPPQPSFAERMRSVVDPLIGPSQSVAAPAPAKKKEDAQPTGSVEFAPPDMKMPTMIPVAPERERRSMLETPPSPVSINPLEQRPSHMMPTPSLARAMDRARGVVNPSYTSLTDTQIA